MGEAFLFKGKWAKPTLEDDKSPIFSKRRRGRWCCGTHATLTGREEGREGS